MAQPLITIGLTSYNAADTIGNAIEAALKQDWPNFEIVIVDDCSSDSSAEIIKGYADQDSRIRLVRHTNNAGFAGALNTLIGAANGDFIAIFDDDDTSAPNRLSLQYQKITAYERETGINLIACYGGIVKKYSNGYQVDMPAIGSRPRTPKGEDIVRYHLYLPRPEGVYYGSGTPSCCLMARKSTFDSVGPYDIHLRRNEDCDFAVRLGLLGGHLIGCAEEIVTQYATTGADKRAEPAFQSELAFVDKYKSLLQSHGRYHYARSWVHVRYYHFSGQKGRAALAVLGMLLRNPVITAQRFFKAAPRRLFHEWKMSLKKYS